MASWRAPGSILEAPGLDFGGSGLNFFKIFACFWPSVPRTCRELAEVLRSLWTPIFDRYASVASHRWAEIF